MTNPNTEPDQAIRRLDELSPQEWEDAIFASVIDELIGTPGRRVAFRQMIDNRIKELDDEGAFDDVPF